MKIQIRELNRLKLSQSDLSKLPVANRKLIAMGYRANRRPEVLLVDLVAGGEREDRGGLRLGIRAAVGKLA